MAAKTTTAARPTVGVATGHGSCAPIPFDRARGPRGLAPYLSAIARAGARPVPLFPGDRASHVDGLCLTGGPDVHPRHYGAAPHPRLAATDPRRDRYELGLAHAARVPVLAICRGMQVLCIARGGVLDQHLDDERPRAGVAHSQRRPTSQTGHGIGILPAARLARVVGTTIDVNSFHHQAVVDTGAGLQPTAWAADGVVEAVEAGHGEPFTIGVQWHPECLNHETAQRALFHSFVEACRDAG
jgi:putative glutamine amidotransferase